MGATKKFAEKVVVELNKKNHTQFAAVRFGNVLGSRGSSDVLGFTPPINRIPCDFVILYTFKELGFFLIFSGRR